MVLVLLSLFSAFIYVVLFHARAGSCLKCHLRLRPLCQSSGGWRPPSAGRTAMSQELSPGPGAGGARRKRGRTIFSFYRSQNLPLPEQHSHFWLYSRGTQQLFWGCHLSWGHSAGLRKQQQPQEAFPVPSWSIGPLRSRPHPDFLPHTCPKVLY